MTVEIRKLTPALAEDYARFFETTHHYGRDDTRCYCVTWCGDNVYDNGGSHWYDSPDERRAHAIQRVKDGDIQGYLAYHEGEIVGWCNANTKSDCKAGVNYIRNEAGFPLDECREGEKVKLIFCYAVAPKVQRKGVATELLQFICQDAAAEGYDCVETYINSQFTDPVHDYKGPLAMYEKNGFTVRAERDGKTVVRKALK
ncbi:MAG: GNAT family N-acetyltransferase [Defluviitaleaceae bacterium]|nr:GNAT family N-acetyltransferase [Defluviitaleaceae bacterium]